LTAGAAGPNLNLACAYDVLHPDRMDFGITLFIFASCAIALLLVLKRMHSYRHQLPRIYELRDSVTNPERPECYFKNLDASLSEMPGKLRHYRNLEATLETLDKAAWLSLKSEVTPLITAHSEDRGWQALFDILNHAKAYAHLKAIGCRNIEFILPSLVSGQRIPDLRAEFQNLPLLCEVKTINISLDEATRRQTGGVGTITDQMSPGLFAKLTRVLTQAQIQLKAFSGTAPTSHMIFVVFNFDDFLHEYADRYTTQIQRYLAENPTAGLDVVLEIKPPFG
jgi:hypothetical protein